MTDLHKEVFPAQLKSSDRKSLLASLQKDLDHISQQYSEIIKHNICIQIETTDSQSSTSVRLDWSQDDRVHSPKHGPSKKSELSIPTDKTPWASEVKSLSIKIIANPNTDEFSSQIYYVLHRLQIYFPHPEKEPLFPALADLKKTLETLAGVELIFKPRFKYRGFHLHTQHPSEFVSGFLMEKKEIAINYLLWLRRNMQNVLQIQMLRSESVDRSNLKELLQLASSFGIFVGLSVSFTFRQQKSLCLISPWALRSQKRSLEALKASLQNLIESYDFQFLTVELGSSEFTATQEELTLHWLEAASEFLSAAKIQLFTKVHVSSNQKSPKYGNFNFLPQFASSKVGILPHTVYCYGLEDAKAPLYGRENFKDISDFMLKEKNVRATWYYPETSYYVGLDIDVPLFLSCYWQTRSEDMDRIELSGIEGHLTFTTGLELGYWLNDWTVTLLSLEDYKSQPLVAVKIISSQDEKIFCELLAFEKKFYKEQSLLSLITSSNLLDELRPRHSILSRTLLRAYKKNQLQLKKDIEMLGEALTQFPSIEKISHPELKYLLELTKLRIEFCFYIRKSLLHKNCFEKLKLDSLLTQASKICSLIKTNYSPYTNTLAH